MRTPRLTERCQNIRTGKNPKLMPGQQRVYRCRNRAALTVRVFEEREHKQTGSGWFSVALCDRCFDEGEKESR